MQDLGVTQSTKWQVLYVGTDGYEVVAETCESQEKAEKLAAICREAETAGTWEVRQVQP